MTRIHQLFDAACAAHPDRPALTDGTGRTLTYAALATVAVPGLKPTAATGAESSNDFDLARIVGQTNALDQRSTLQRLRGSLDLEVLDQRHGIAVVKLASVAVLYNDVGHNVLVW